MRLPLLLALPLALSAGAAFAQAPRDAEPVNVKVSLKHLDLATAAGQEEALRRVRSAAAVACTVDPQAGVLAQQTARQCTADAIASGRQAIVRVAARAQAGVAQMAANAAPGNGTR